MNKCRVKILFKNKILYYYVSNELDVLNLVVQYG